MENASKALIIAGAILLSILIIALGMRIYNSSTSSAANADLSATEITSFNSTFEAYEGKQKGTAVRTLITAVKSSNDKNKDRLISINGAESEYATATYNSFSDQTNIKSNKTYNVSFHYNATNGLIDNVNITEQYN